MKGAGYTFSDDPKKPAFAAHDQINYPVVIFWVALTTIFTAMIYGPMAAMLVSYSRLEFVTLRCRCHHIGNGWFGGLLPTIAFTIVAATGNIFAGLWYPVIVAAVVFVVALLFLPETKERNIDA